MFIYNIMSSTRLPYDTCAYKERITESTAPLDYSLYTGKFENCTKCRVELGIVGGNNVSLFSGNLVDLESDLRGQTRPASLCSSMKYHPKCEPNPNSTDGLPCSGSQQYSLNHQPACQMFRYPKVPQAPPMKQYRCNYQTQSRSRN